MREPIRLDHEGQLCRGNQAVEDIEVRSEGFVSVEIKQGRYYVIEEPVCQLGDQVPQAYRITIKHVLAGVPYELEKCFMEWRESSVSGFDVRHFYGGVISHEGGHLAGMRVTGNQRIADEVRSG